MDPPLSIKGLEYSDPSSSEIFIVRILSLFRTRGFFAGLVLWVPKLNFWGPTEPDRGVSSSDGRGVGDCKVVWSLPLRSDDSTRRRFDGVPDCWSSSR